MRAVDIRDAFCLHPLPGGGAVAALRGLGLSVPAGELLVVHGPNGSGKTTLMGVLAGDRALAAGQAQVAGLDLAAAGARDLARWRSRQLGQVDQDARRLLRTEFDVLDNIALQLRIAGTARSKARAAGLAALGELGLADLAGRRIETLSGGQRQRVAVCAAVAHRPQLVLADEPTGELDVRSAEGVYELLADAVRAVGATLVLVTHDRRAGQIADRVVRIRDGRISETWDPRGPARPGPGRELLVMDDRGWIRLPQPVREQVMGGALWSAEVSEGAVRLSRDGAPVVPVPPVRDQPARRETEAGILVEFEDVSFGYDGGPPVLGPGLRLSVRSGEVAVVAGRSGTGKSTLLRVALGLQRPDAGTVKLAGQNLAGLDRDGLARLRSGLSAVVLQQVDLSSALDCVDEIDLARAARGLPADPALALSLLGRLGLAGLARRRVEALSGGERQRLALARALALDPRLLVLDEPTSQLDEASAQLVAEVLRERAAEGTTVLVASHDPVLTGPADQLLTPR
ncbi:hypothetical protein Kisp01_08520 [Kineosporia sp. NBRC 101677]|uniref:ATP-binding cassette domain-containing protein n=1 Tax=Kineosporia sp. NBRC 101677 TaxID=3032197 RepID=UPI0024A38B16|nr:ATP-binding cassette domain-containing protein [Kineosporia sp. NBRC 101677]GLY13836.1 hypothetical protein Kisp01_08520 [Kineosporia sp. NBRC 101677]